jgi:hypothetical protein
MSGEHIHDRNLRHLMVEAANGVGVYDGGPIKRNRAQHGLHLSRRIGNDLQIDAGREISHHLIRDRALKLRIDRACRERIGASGEIEMDRRDIGEAQA